MILIIVAVVTLYACFYYFVTKRYKFWSNRNVKQVPPSLLQGGNFKFWPKRKSFSDTILYVYNYYPNNRYSGIYQFLKPTLLVRDPELIKQIAIKSFENFMNHPNLVDPKVDPYWGNNLAARQDNEWRTMRSTLTPSFTLSKMRTLYSLMDEVAIEFAKHIENNNKNVVELELKDTLSRVATDIISTTAFGLNIDSLNNPNNDFFIMGKQMTNLKGWRSVLFFINALSPTFSRIFKIRIIPKHLGDYFAEMIQEAIKMREQNGIKRQDMIQLLLDAKKKQTDTSNPITNDDIVCQALVFFFGGFDSISTAMSFTLYELTMNPKIQNRLYNEIIEQDEPITYESLQKMKYLDMVIAESLRKWPAATLTNRIVNKAFTIDPIRDGESIVTLEVGTHVWFPIFGLHHDAKYFPNPEKFDPERFNDENKSKIAEDGAYIPFGVGPRMCIGNRFALMEMKVLIVNILKKFELVKTERTPEVVVLDKNDANLSVLGGTMIGFKKR